MKGAKCELYIKVVRKRDDLWEKLS